MKLEFREKKYSKLIFLFIFPLFLLLPYRFVHNEDFIFFITGVMAIISIMLIMDNPYSGELFKVNSKQSQKAHFSWGYFHAIVQCRNSFIFANIFSSFLYCLIIMVIQLIMALILKEKYFKTAFMVSGLSLLSSYLRIALFASTLTRLANSNVLSVESDGIIQSLFNFRPKLNIFFGITLLVSSYTFTFYFNFSEKLEIILFVGFLLLIPVLHCIQMKRVWRDERKSSSSFHNINQRLLSKLCLLVCSLIAHSYMNRQLFEALGN